MFTKCWSKVKQTSSTAYASTAPLRHSKSVCYINTSPAKVVLAIFFKYNKIRIELPLSFKGLKNRCLPILRPTRYALKISIKSVQPFRRSLGTNTATQDFFYQINICGQTQRESPSYLNKTFRMLLEDKAKRASIEAQRFPLCDDDTKQR